MTDKQIIAGQKDHIRRLEDRVKELEQEVIEIKGPHVRCPDADNCDILDCEHRHPHVRTDDCSQAQDVCRMCREVV